MQVLWMVMSTFLFSTMGVFIKYASESFNTAEIVFYRGLIGMAILWWMARSQNISLKTRHPGMHLWRSVVGVVSMACWFYALTQIPLASAMTLNYMSSLWIAVIMLAGALWTLRPNHAGPRQALNTPLVVTIVIGFVGVVLMLQPSFAQDQTVPALIGLASGLLAAFAYMQLSALGRVGEPDARTVFYFGLGSTVMGAAGMAVIGMSDWPGWRECLWLLPIGLLAAGGQMALTKAYSSVTTRKGTLVAANLQYSGIVFASFYSLFLFGDALGASGWAGMVLITGCGIAASIFRARGAVQPAPKPMAESPATEANTAATQQR